MDYDYAKGMLVMHKLWSKRKPLTDLLNDKEATVNTFLHMIERNKMPLYALLEFHHVV